LAGNVQIELTIKHKQMKRILYSVIALFVITVIAVSQSAFTSANISVEITETKATYKLLAEYNKSQTDKVQRSIDRRLVNTTIDATLKLSGKPSFYIKASPGRLKIVFNKNQHDEESCNQMKKIYARIEDIIEGNKIIWDLKILVL
jgi:hypothetical protein